jgi:uncharacterized protein (TIGR04255 family)
MAVQRHLTRAPITEALIDIRINLPQEIDIARLKTIHASISKEYPQVKERVKGEFKFKLVEKSVETTPVSVYGFQYISSDGKQVVQARLDGFTFSRLKPYEIWENLRKEAYRLWEIYASLFSPERITRVALRYINCLEIPLLPSIEFKDYLVTPPEVPKELPQVINSFLTRVVIPIPSLGATAIIIQAFEGTSDPSIIPIILDIDVFREAQFNANGKDAWETHLQTQVRTVQ